MKLRCMVLFLMVAIVAGAVAAHGDKKHVLGTVEKITASSVMVKQRDGKSVEVKLTAETIYLVREGKEDKPARFSDLTVGDLVVIHASPKGDTLEADEIKFSAPGTAAGAAAPKS
jgi:Domain of unknown function (DUF5666)